uniref:DNA-directed DNA/RNA polymerase mu n=1 Tax=Callorhinchus milii TaxID=7868 RepID=A0A4W3HYN5_CALMI
SRATVYSVGETRTAASHGQSWTRFFPPSPPPRRCYPRKSDPSARRLVTGLLESVTHIVSENNSGDEVLAFVEKQSTVSGERLSAAALVDITWFTDSMGAGRLLEIETRHRLQVLGHLLPPSALSNTATGKTPDALKILAENAEYYESVGRYLAFTRVSSILKSLPYAVTSVDSLRGFPGLGEHCRKVIEEILEDGVCQEVESVTQSQRYQTLTLFTSIFGVGVKTAEKWYKEQHQTLADLRASQIRFTKEQQVGLQYYEDLTTPVTRAEADMIRKTVEEAVYRYLPGAVITLAGGFRRGKETGHDVDFLITHPEEGKEKGLVTKVIHFTFCFSQGLMLYSDEIGNSYQKCRKQETSKFDHFERCFTIVKLNQELVNAAVSGNDSREGGQGAGGQGAGGQGAGHRPEDKHWKAVRVDLVIVPISQFAYALLGWTGSQLFERELRRYAKNCKHMILTSHALYHPQQNEYFSAAAEEEIFAHLELDYIAPWERNA